MKKILLILLCSSLIQKTLSQSIYAPYPVYQGNDLGLTYNSAATHFRIWSPVAEAAEMMFYTEGTGGTAFQTNALLQGENGTWYLDLPGDWKTTFYTVRVKINGSWSNEVTDPYAKVVGINGRREIVIDPEDTNPENWLKDKSPAFSKGNLATDAVIYELHIRDASISNSSGVLNKGKFTGLAETGTVNKDGFSTGLSHLKELGVTHIHLLPFYDFNSVDESMPEKNNTIGDTTRSTTTVRKDLTAAIHMMALPGSKN